MKFAVSQRAPTGHAKWIALRALVVVVPQGRLPLSLWERKSMYVGRPANVLHSVRVQYITADVTWKPDASYGGHIYLKPGECYNVPHCWRCAT